jgi:hypothetical protein
MENSQLKQFALLDVSILNFSIMLRRPQRGCPLRVDSAPPGRSFTSAQRLRDHTHRELVYRSLQFQKRSQQFIGTHNETHVAARRFKRAAACVSRAILQPKVDQLLPGAAVVLANRRGQLQ